MAQSPGAAALGPITQTQQNIDQLRVVLDTLSKPLATATQALNQPGGAGAGDARTALESANQALTDAKRLIVAVDTQAEQAALTRASETSAVYVVLAVTAGFVLISTAVILVLSANVRRSFYGPAADKDADGTWRTYLMQLPLGAPEGSIRALLSMYVVIFGLLVLVMQRRLGLQSVDAIAGFVGIVITFYFTARTNDQAQKAVGAAVQAANDATTAAKTSADKAASAVAGVTQDINQHTAAQVQTVISALTAGRRTDGPDAAGSGAAGAAPDDNSRLRDIQGDLQVTRQLMGALKGLGVGSDLFAGAESLAGNADQVLGTIEQVLQGSSDAPPAAKVVDAASQLLGQLGDVGVPGVLGGAVSVLGPVMKVAGPALAGLAGGPVGLVAGLVTGGLQVISDQQKFNAWKAALLAKPFDRSLLPPTVDGNMALLARELAPLMSKRLEGAAPDVATELLRACITPAADGNPKSSSDLAHDLLTGADPLGLKNLFGSETELSEALEEYRTSAIFVRARDELSGQIAIPAIAGAPATSVDMGALLTGAFKLRQDPRAGSALEKIVYLVQALGALHLDPGRLADLVQAGLQAGAAMAGTTRTVEDPRK